MLTNDEIDALSREAMKLPLAELIVSVSSILTPILVVYMCGKDDVLVLGAWMTGQERITPVENLRLRYGYVAAEILNRNYDEETARAAFLGMNRYLDDEAPASWLRDHNEEKDLKEVVAAARNFGEMGG